MMPNSCYGYVLYYNLAKLANRQKTCPHYLVLTLKNVLLSYLYMYKRCVFRRKRNIWISSHSKDIEGPRGNV